MTERYSAILPNARLLLTMGLAALMAGPFAMAAPAPRPSIAGVEARLKGRIGVFAMRGSATVKHRTDERFAYCSTFKWVLGAAVLKRVEEGRLDLARKVTYSEKDLLEPCALTRAHLREGMSIGELCAATITTSDNTAANLLEPLVGGPSGMQAFVRGLGDAVMRFDRMEPELNSNLPGDPRDTTTPEAMARLLRTVLETEALSKASREQLLGWMKATTTGSRRIRAGVPQGWIVANKTGTGSNGIANDVAVLYPPQGAPIFLCIFTESRRAEPQAREAAIAEVTRLALEELR